MKEIREILEKRKELYQLLSYLFLGEVPERFLIELINGEFWIEGNEDIEIGVEIMKDYVEKRGLEGAKRDIEDEYSKLVLFSANVPLTKSHVYEGAEYGKTSLEVEEKIREMGYRMKTHTLPPDHISSLFDFMATLIDEALNGEDELKESLRKQDEFLENEIMSWVPDALKKLEKVKGFYSGVGRFARGFLELDANVIKELKLW